MAATPRASGREARRARWNTYVADADADAAAAAVTAAGDTVLVRPTDAGPGARTG